MATVATTTIAAVEDAYAKLRREMEEDILNLKSQEASLHNDEQKLELNKIQLDAGKKKLDAQMADLIKRVQRTSR